MKYLEDTGTVISVTEKEATIRLDHKRSDACGGCCACSALAGGQPGVTVARGDLKEGYRVRVRIPQVNTYLSMLLVFGLPLVLFVAGIWTGQRLEGGDRIGNLSVAGGVTGLVVAFLVAWVANRILSKRAGEPEAHRLAQAQQAPGETADAAN